MKHLLLFAAFVLAGFGLHAQSCSGCPSSSPVITVNSSTSFSAASAQAYYWEICSGSASISGSNTGQSVSVTCSGNYSIKVTRFVNGDCYEACISRSCFTGGGTCPTSSNIGYSNEGSGGTCHTGLAYLNGISGVSSVNWTWALGSYSGSINNAGTATPIYYPSGNWNNYYIVICATATLNNGTVCPKVCRSFLLNCGSGPGDPISPRVGIFPNPTEDEFSIQNERDVEVRKVVVLDAMGQPIRNLSKGATDKIDLSDQQSGTYYVRIEFEDGQVETRILELR